MDHLLNIVKEFKNLGNKIYVDKGCFAHDAAYSDSKNLAKRTISDKILKDRSYEIAINSKYDGYQRALASMVNKFFDKKTGTRLSKNEKLSEELHELVIKKKQKKKSFC